MSRPLKIQYPDAWYHVMNRGRRREEVYIDKGDYIAFIELLHEASEVFNVGAYSSVSSVVNRTGSQLQTDSRLKKSYLQIYSALTMRQAKT